MAPLLTKMLGDSDLGNHRLALTTLNSAIHNKMHLLLPHLGELLPAVFGDSQIKPELIREVQMGPFKHKVDDGLDLRKVGYSTQNSHFLSNPRLDRLRNSLRRPRHFFCSLARL